MATQAVVSVRQNGEMKMKFVCGCNGMTAPALAQAIKALGRVPQIMFEAQKLARQAQFGCDDCLVISTPNHVLMECTNVTNPASRILERTTPSSTIRISTPAGLREPPTTSRS